jgi:hypothetical protein
MRISICNWNTTADDIARSLAAVERAISSTAGK